MKMAGTVCFWFMTVMCTLCMVQMVNARFIENSSLIGNEVKQGDLDTGIEVSKKEKGENFNTLACQCNRRYIEYKNLWYCLKCNGECPCGQSFHRDYNEFVCVPCRPKCVCYFEKEKEFRCCGCCKCGDCTSRGLSIFVNHNGVHTGCCECSSSSSGCFPSTAQVILESGKSVAMSELQIGDKVQTASLDDRVTYSEVRTFLQKETTLVAMYKSVSTSLNTSISLTGTHLIYARKSGTDQFNAMHADNISVGDEVLVEGNDKLTPLRVINVSNIMMQGAYDPLTVNGKIVVDGVLASCYASFNHDLAHIGMTPIKWFPETIELMFGEDTESNFIKAAKEIGRWVLPLEKVN